MVTRKDVANKANVSPSVVSYVINNSNYVSEEKRTAVMKAIEELGYRPNYLAKSLKMNKTNSIAIVGDDIRNEYFNELLYYFDDIAFEKGYTISLFGSKYVDLKMLIPYKWDGLYICTSKYDEERLNNIAKTDTKVIIANNKDFYNLDKRITLLDMDLYNSMKAIVNYVILNGHRRIAFFSPTEIKTINENNYRLRGYADALKENDLMITPEYIEFGSKDLNEYYSKLKMMMSLSSGKRPTAIVAGNDSIALRLIGYLRDNGIKVPEDISIVGAGNIDLGRFYNPALTSINYYNNLIVEKVINCIIHKSEGTIKKILIKSEPVIRNSVISIK